MHHILVYLIKIVACVCIVCTDITRGLHKGEEVDGQRKHATARTMSSERRSNMPPSDPRVRSATQHAENTEREEKENK